MTNLRILSGGIAQESHSFNPVLTGRSRFTINCGPEAVQSARGTNSTLGGIVDSAYEGGHTVIVPVIYRAQSGGPVEEAVFSEVLDIMCNAARRGDFEAIVLPLHGGMLTPSLADPEGRLIAALREIVGPDMPITAAYDLHAHVTTASLNDLDFLAGYLTNPHEDQAATSRRAFRAAVDMMQGAFEPHGVAVRFPMLTLGHDRTDESPLQELHAKVRDAIASGAVYDASIFNAQQYLDVPDLGQVVVVYGNGPDQADAAQRLASDLADGLWAARDVVRGRYPSVAECLDRASQAPRPLVLGDQGDRVAAGGYGDSTFILRALLERSLPSTVPITDPQAVRLCEQAGVGAEVDLEIGGKVTRVSPPVKARGKVVRLGRDAGVTYGGPADRGYKTAIEGFAVVCIGAVQVLLTTQPYAYIDPEYYRAAGIDPAALKVVVTRSGYHFTLNYASVGETITVDTPGITSYYVEQLPWAHARPFYPVDQMEFRGATTMLRRSAGPTQA